MLWRLRNLLASRKEDRLRKIPIGFVITREQFYTLFLMSDFELVEAFVANIDISGMAMQELLRRYHHYDISAHWFVDDVASLIHIGEVS